jgi:CBS domain-containing protein
MTGRKNIDLLAPDPDENKLREAVLRSAASRLLVAEEGNLDKLVSIVWRADVLARLAQGANVDLLGIAVPPAYVSDNANVLSVLETLKSVPIHMVTVVDEFGSVVGIATLADVLEAVAGDVTRPKGSAMDIEVSHLSPQTDGSYLVSGNKPVDDIASAHPAYRARPKDAKIRTDLEFVEEACCKRKETRMPDRSSGSIMTVTLAAAVLATLSIPLAVAQAPATSDTAPVSAVKTPWGDPDLQGIWTDETDTPLQRPPKYANQEFFTAAQREGLDRERSALLRRDKRVERGTELDVAGAYNGLFQSYKRSGKRTSMIVAPSDGLIPAMTPEAQKSVAADRQFRLALLQATETCKSKSVACGGGKYDPTPSQGSQNFRRAITPRG